MLLCEPFLRQALSFEDLESRLDAVAPKIHEIDILKKRLRDRYENAKAMEAERGRVGNILDALATVSDILPDDSYLTEFTMFNRRMTLSGVSSSASRLIELLAADSRVGNPGFIAAITREPSPGLRARNGDTDMDNDVFSIQSELVGR
jgi:general secretion pathway protein L